MYFLRRFLDKKYIKNAIIYGGRHHTKNYIYLLKKYFDFKITNFSYLNIPTDKLTSIIKNTDDDYNVEKLYKYFKNGKTNETYQCSNLTGFPDKFS